MAKTGTENQLIRLNRFLADAGICSRRKADELIKEGLVKVNGKTTIEMGLKINPSEDFVLYKGRRVQAQQEKVYYAFNKPKNVVTTTDDPMGRPHVMEFLSNNNHRLFPVGRLDWGTEGLLLITNDGEFANEVANPKSQITKTYIAKLDGQPTQEQLNKLMNGVTIVGGRVNAILAEKVKFGGSSKYDWVKIVITEGKNRQVRKMFEKIGFDVKKLHRVGIGELKIGALKPGHVRKLKSDDLLKIFKIAKVIANPNTSHEPRKKRPSTRKNSPKASTKTKKTNSGNSSSRRKP